MRKLTYADDKRLDIASRILAAFLSSNTQYDRGHYPLLAANALEAADALIAKIIDTPKDN